MTKRLNIQDLLQKKEAGEKMVMATAADYTLARLADQAGVDILLVEDSLGQFSLGYESPLSVTLADILYHTRPVARGSHRALVMADLPYAAYHINPEQALGNALRLIQEGGAGAVLLEGGRDLTPVIQQLRQSRIPAFAHIGLQAKTAALWDGYRTQGLDEDSAWALVATAQNLEEAGAAGILLHCVTAEVAKLVTERLDIPVFGIGSGSHCDGQLLRSHDLLGLSEPCQPHYVRRFAEGGALLSAGLKAFCQEVREGGFPGEEHSFPMAEDEAKRLY